MKRPILFMERAPARETTTIDGAEFHHLIRVRRLAVGDEFEIRSGGKSYRAKITAVRADSLDAAILSERALGAPAVKITVIQAILKGDAMDLAINQLTQAGATHIIPALTEHCVVQLKPSVYETKAERWRRIAQNAAEQSGQPAPPEIAAPLPFADTLAAATQPLKLAADIYADSSISNVPQIESARDIALAVGPEGGFSPNELRALKESEWISVSLGQSVYRASLAGAIAVGNIIIVNRAHTL